MATFRYFRRRKDRDLVCFTSDDPSLLGAICANPITGYVRQSGDYVMVPYHAAAGVAAYLERLGWAKQNPA